MTCKFFCVLSLCCVTIGVQAAYKDGSYIGVGAGNAGPISVEVRVEAGKIASVKVLKHTETPILLKAAEKKISKAVVKKNSTEDIAVVSGATNSCNGILQAVNAALKRAQ